MLEDYTDRSSEAADLTLYHRVDQGDPILSAGPGNQFALWHVRDDQRVEYVVEKDASTPGNWRVRETARRSPAVEEGGPKPAEPIRLSLRDRISLGSTSSANTPAIRDVAALGFTDAGNPEFMRHGPTAELAYVRLGPNGAVEFEKDLTSILPSDDAWPSFFDLTGDRWLLGFSGETPWIEVDVKTGTAKPAPLPVGSPDCAIAPMPDGSYVALVPQIVRSMGLTELFYVRADGSIGWSERVIGVGPDDTAFQRIVSSAKGVVRTSERTVTLLGPDDLTVIDLGQNVLRTSPLSAVLGHDAGYLTDLHADGHGGVYFWEDGRYWRADAQGNPAGSFVPKRADGTTDSAFHGLLEVAPDGRVWTSDRARLYRLNDTGVADLVLGPPQQDDELTEPGDTLIDGLGRILIRDRVSQSVHVFDSQGTKLFQCKVAPAERASDSYFDSIRAQPDGSIWVVVRDGLLQFDSRGARVMQPAKPVKKGSIRVAKELAAVDTVKQATASIQRRPDGKWLTAVSERAVLHDGRRVLLEVSGEKNSTPTLHFYGRQNEPIESIPLPEGTESSCLSTSARWIVVGGYGPAWTLIRMEDHKIHRFASGLEDPGNWLAGQTPDGRTLLLFNARRRELVRYDLP